MKCGADPKTGAQQAPACLAPRCAGCLVCQLTLPTCSDSSHGIEMRQREAGMAGPPKAEPELTTSVAAALDSGSAHAAGGGDDDANSDSEELAAAEAFVDKLAARMSSRQRQRGPAQVENAAPAEGAREEGASDADGMKRRAVAQDGLDEITLCVEEQGVSTVDQATSGAPASARNCDHCHAKQASFSRVPSIAALHSECTSKCTRPLIFFFANV